MVSARHEGLPFRSRDGIVKHVATCALGVEKEPLTIEHFRSCGRRQKSSLIETKYSLDSNR
jgi:hypothetical protein